ncbi:hypothetical protein HYV82_03780 [Candidatus Woesearchaeota archaeon]|nr:hypothetical protein [Candidatus Woesearchaeota archaeon]
MPSLDRLVFSAVGAAAYYASGLVRREVADSNSGQAGGRGDSPAYILPAFWYAPDRKAAVREIQDMKRLLGEGNGRFRLGVSVFVRHMGDVAGKDFHYDPSSLEAFLDVCVNEGTPVFINTGGVQWTEVAYRESPLIQKLMQSPENRVILKDGEGNVFPAPRKRQPGFQDRNGLSYLCMYSPEVQHYWNRNLSELADVVSAFSSQYPGLFVGMSTENETDLPGKWAGGRVLGSDYNSDYNRHFVSAYKAASCEGNNISQNDFRVFSVRLRNILSANMLLAAGIPKNRIYTHISTEDAETRASPLEVGIVGSAGNLGVVWWGAGHFPSGSLAAAKNSAVGAGNGFGVPYCQGFGILASNPLSFSPAASRAFLEEAIRLCANPIVPYCWWPYFTGYGIKGLPFESALREVLK